jgi:cytochrome c peroxidase
MNPSARPVARIAAVIIAGAFLPDAMANDTPAATAATANVAEIRELLVANGVVPLDPPPPRDPAKWELGRALFFDPVIGGNRDVSCATCHHPDTATADGRARAVGTLSYVDGDRRIPLGFRLVEVAAGERVLTGFKRGGAPHGFTPRNSPDLFNRGDSAWTTMFWDSRAHRKEDGGFAVNAMRITKSPGLYQVEMPAEVENLLAAQAMMPVLSNDEMRGAKGETGATGERNEVGQIPGQNEEQIWAALMDRLLGIPGYRELFAKAYPEKAVETLHFAHAANAIAAFETDAFTLLDSPFDRFLAGDDAALDESQREGAKLFYTKARCAACHSGKLFTDQLAHNIGVIPIGPGPDPAEIVDFGIAHRSNAGLDQKFAFRTPPLRNVALTAPYMHNGAYTTLEAAVRHHLQPERSLDQYDPTQLEPEFRGAVHDDPLIHRDLKRTLSKTLRPLPRLDDREVNLLLAFLHSLTAPSASQLGGLVPETVPSGLDLIGPLPPKD